MLRLSAEGLALFLLPFAAYAALLLLGQRLPFAQRGWGPRPLVLMATIGCAFAILGLLGLGLFGERSRGDYVPAHMDGSRLVPGHME